MITVICTIVTNESSFYGTPKLCAPTMAMSIFSAKTSASDRHRGRYRVGPQVEADGSLISFLSGVPVKCISGTFSKPIGGMWSAPVINARILSTEIITSPTTRPGPV